MKQGIKGITLIALIVAVIIILILGTVTINMTFGEEGFLSQSQEMQRKREREASREEDRLNETIEYFDEEKEKNNEDDTDIIKKVAQIGSKTYVSLQEAIDDVLDNNTRRTIKLLMNTTESITIPANKNIVLDLNGHTLNNNADISIKPTIKIEVGGTLTINNGNVVCEGTIGTTIQNQGTLTIASTAQIINNCTTTGMAINSNDASAIVTIIGGTVSSSSTRGSAINNFGTLEISGAATISGAQDAIRNQEGTVSIGSDVTIIGNKIGI